MTTRVVLYIRVSSEEQELGHSLAAQEREMRTNCATRDWQIAEILSEVQSAWTDRIDARPTFQRLLNLVEHGAVDVCMVHTFDRWSRNLLVTLQTFQFLAAHGVTFVSVTENIDYATPQGKLFVAMLGAFAQYYSDAISQHVSKSKRERVRKGRHNNIPPYGYCAGTCTDCQHSHHGPVCPYIGADDRGDGRIPIRHPIESAGTLLALETCAGGECDADVARALNEAGYRTRHHYKHCNPKYLWTKDSVREMLTNRFYRSEVQYRGEWFPGEQESLGSPELWERVAAARAVRAYRPRTVRRDAYRIYPLAGIACCARCGRPLRGMAAQGKRYYRDGSRQDGLDCPQLMVLAEDLEDQVGAWLRRVALPVAWRERVLAILAERERTQPRPNGESQKALAAQLARLRDAYVLGDYERAEYLVERRRLQERLAQVTASAQSHGQALAAAAALLDDFATLWDRANLAERKRILGTVFESVYVRDHDLVAVQPREPFRQLLGHVGNHVPMVTGFSDVASPGGDASETP